MTQQAALTTERLRLGQKVSTPNGEGIFWHYIQEKDGSLKATVCHPKGTVAPDVLRTIPMPGAPHKNYAPDANVGKSVVVFYPLDEVTPV